MLIAAQYQLDNLTVIVDWNGLQGSDYVTNILPLSDGRLVGIARVLGWEAYLEMGHDVAGLTQAIQETQEVPKLIVAQTTKGKGASFMEGRPEWHAKWLDPKHEEIVRAELA
jgi:transketolase